MAATIVGPVNTISPGLPGGNSAALNVTAAIVLKAAPGFLGKVVCVTAGSLTLNDNSALTGNSAANEIWSGSMTAGQVLQLDWPCGTGITVSAVTTAVLSISYS